MPSAMPPAPRPRTLRPTTAGSSALTLADRRDSLDLFFTLAALVQKTGARIEYGLITDDAHWNAATQTLTLRADADTPEHAYALGEFCRRIKLGPAYSHFTTAAPRRLRAVT